MQINVTFDSSVSAAPAGFTSAINYVVNILDAAFTNKVSLNIDVGWGEIEGSTLNSDDLGESEESSAPSYNYSTIKSALLANEPSPLQQAAYATLPSTDPTTGGNFDIGSADAKALGLIPGNAPGIDGWVGFSSSADWSFEPNVKPSGGAYDFIGIAEHEITEVMGRDSLLGETNYYTDAFTVMDLFRYSASGVRELTTGPKNSTGYFSINNGTTNLGTWNNHAANGDLGDWYPAGPGPAGNDSFNDYSNDNVLNPLTSSDLALMNVVGWDPSVPAGTIINGETDFISSGQTASTDIVIAGGYLIVGSGGTSLADTLSGGVEQIYKNGTASGTVVSNGGSEYISNGGIAFDAVICAGGLGFIYNGGVTSGTVVSAGGVEFVALRGTASGAILSSGGAAEAFGAEIDTALLSGGYDYILAGGSASGAKIAGIEDIYGSAISATVSSGGLQFVFGAVTSTTVSSGGLQYIAGAGSETSTTVLNDGTDVVAGSAMGAAVAGGGSDYVLSGATASGTRLAGIEDVYGSDTGAVISSGAAQIVLSGGAASSVTVLSGGIEYVGAGGAVNTMTISSGGAALAAGSESGVTVLSGGYNYVLSGGVASGTEVAGLDDVYGTENDAVVSAGALQVVLGTASGTNVAGEQLIYGSTAADTIQSGSFAVVESGGFLSASQINSGGMAYVLSGGSAGAETISGGKLEVLSSGAANGLITFATSAGGTLRLDESQTFSGTIAGFGQPDHLDLSDISFGSGTSVGFTEAGNNLSGTLSVSDGTHSASILLLGQYSAAHFTSASDGHGGTLIGDPPLAQVASGTTTSVTFGGQHG